MSQSLPVLGERRALSPPRRIVVEMMRCAERIPLIPVARTLHLAALARARDLARPRPSWTALFLRGYGLLGRRCPELRRCYVSWPRPHLYEHPHTLASVAIERVWQGEPVVLAAKVNGPENQSVTTISGHLQRFKEAPLESILDFQQLLRVGRLPGWLRRFVFWHSFSLSGRRRCLRFGTFMLSSYGSLGAEQFFPRSPHTSLVTFGPIAPDGSVAVRIVYDHRVLDGSQVARFLRELEVILCGEVRAEVAELAKAAA